MFAIYKNNPTAGAQDGSKVSEGDGSNPIMIGALDAATNEVSNGVTLAIRCDEGFANVDSNAVISLAGTKMCIRDRCKGVCRTKRVKRVFKN